MASEDMDVILSARMTNLERDSTQKHLDNVVRLTKIETILESAVERLFGNGQPGIVDSHEGRIKRLENLAVKIGAIAGVLIFLIEALHEVPLKMLLGIK